MVRITKKNAHFSNILENILEWTSFTFFLKIDGTTQPCRMSLFSVLKLRFEIFWIFWRILWNIIWAYNFWKQHFQPTRTNNLIFPTTKTVSSIIWKNIENKAVLEVWYFFFTCYCVHVTGMIKQAPSSISTRIKIIPHSIPLVGKFIIYLNAKEVDTTFFFLDS